MKCENCNKEHDGSYGSGRFCSKSCKQQYIIKPKENKHYCCRFCGKEFEKPTSLAAHVSNCKLNPNSSKTRSKAAKTRNRNAKEKNPLITIKTKCCNCGKEFQQTITTKEYKQNAFHKCCSSYCAHSYASKFVDNEKKSQTIKNKLKSGQRIGFCKLKQRKSLYCKICGKQIEQYKSKLYCSKECATIGTRNKLSIIAKIRCSKGEFGGKNNDTYKKHKHGWYKGIYCGSSWELAFLLWALDHKLNIQRCNKVFTYKYNGQTYNYYPDFEIDGVIYEIKGFENYKAKAKHQAFPDIIVLKYVEMKDKLEYVKNTYGKDFVNLLESKQV